jgi:hypothetical protein
MIVSGFRIVLGLGKAVTAAWRSTRDRNTPRFSRRLVRLAKKPSIAFRCVVEHETRMAIEPGPRLGVFVAAAIVEDNVDKFASRDKAFDRVQKTDELAMAVTLHAAADDFALEHVKGRQTESSCCSSPSPRSSPQCLSHHSGARLRRIVRAKDSRWEPMMRPK